MSVVPDEVEERLAVPQGQGREAGWKLLEKLVKDRGESVFKLGQGHWQKNGLRAVHTGDGVVAMKSWVDFSGTIPVQVQEWRRREPGCSPYAKTITVGHSIHFDCKKVAGASMPLKASNFHSKQKRQMMSHASSGATCFLLVHFNARELKTRDEPAATWAVPIYPGHEFWEANNAGEVMMLSRSAAETHGVAVEWNKVGKDRTYRPDILKAVTELREMRCDDE